MLLLRFLIWPLSLLYGFAVWVRNKLYDYGWLDCYEADFPVIVVGNISLGGTGKTPLCLWLLEKLSNRGHSVAYIARGYGRRTRGLKHVSPASTPAEVGDEAVMVLRRCSQALVLVAENRVEALRYVHKRLGADAVAVLDDAFQHRQVKPRLAVVLLTERDLKWPRWVLPAGRLREPVSALKRAHALILTKAEKTIPHPLAGSGVPGKNLFHGNVRIHSFRSFPDNLVAERPSGKHFLAFCGIGYPRHFLNSLQAFGTVAAKRIFADHHQYSVTDVREIVTDFDMLPHPDKALVTTEKDFVRLSALPNFSDLLGQHTLWIAQSEFVFDDKADEERFIQIVYDTCSLKSVR